MPDWRDRVAWPLAVDTSYYRGRALIQRLLDALPRIDDGKHRDIATLAAGRILATMLPTTELSYAIQEQHRRGWCLEGAWPALAYLSGECETPASVLTRPLFKQSDSLRAAALRRIARINSWTPWWRVPATLASPQILAISHNELLVEAARVSGLRISFRHAELLFLEARQKTDGSAGDSQCRDLAEYFVEALKPAGDLDQCIVRRWRRLVAEELRGILRCAANDLQVLRDLRHLPRIVWAGTGGYWPARAIALEVRRRGGLVTCFDHGHNRALHDIQEWPMLMDMAIADRFVMATDGGAARLSARITGEGSAIARNCRIEALGTAPDLLRHVAGVRNRSVAAYPTVVYAPGILRGFRQTVPAVLPDLIYLDWQMRLMEFVQTLPVNILCRPHPEGLMRRQRHPLADVLPLATCSFEELMPEADVFLFDDTNSRIFCQAVVSDRPVVFVNVGAPYFAPEVKPLIDARCTVINARFDERGRPFVDEQTLAQALEEAVPPNPPALYELRELLVGTNWEQMALQ